MKPTLLIAALFAVFLPSQFAHAFGVDVCFNDPASGQAPIRNCIGVEEVCRTSNLDATQQLQCRVAATADSLSGLSGTNAIIGGRSLVHSDSTYLMAQLLQRATAPRPRLVSHADDRAVAGCSRCAASAVI